MIVSKIIEYGQEMPQSQTVDCRPSHGNMRKGHNIGIVQALTVQYNVYFKFPFSFNVNNYAQIRLRFAWILAQPN